MPRGLTTLLEPGERVLWHDKRSSWELAVSIFWLTVMSAATTVAITLFFVWIDPDFAYWYILSIIIFCNQFAQHAAYIGTRDSSDKQASLAAHRADFPTDDN